MVFKNYWAMVIPQLQAELIARKLPYRGTKSELLDRLMNSDRALTHSISRSCEPSSNDDFDRDETEKEVGTGSGDEAQGDGEIGREHGNDDEDDDGNGSKLSREQQSPLMTKRKRSTREPSEESIVENLHRKRARVREEARRVGCIDLDPLPPRKACSGTNAKAPLAQSANVFRNSMYEIPRIQTKKSVSGSKITQPRQPSSIYVTTNAPSGK